MIGLSTVKDIFDIASTGLQIYSSVQQYQTASDTYDLQKKELDRQQSIETARAKRDARVRTAQLLAAQGSAGAVTSTATSGVIGIESSLQAGLTDLDYQMGLQADQYQLSASRSKTQAVVNTFAELGTFSVTDVGKSTFKGAGDFLEGLSDSSGLVDEANLFREDY